MPVSPAQISKILRTIYPDDGSLERITLQSPALALLPKKEDASGSSVQLTVQYGSAAGVSDDFIEARAQTGRDSGIANFVFGYNKKYSTVSFDEFDSLAATSAGAVTDATQLLIDNAADSLREQLAMAIFGTLGGSVATVKSGQGTTTLVLTEPGASYLFRVGDRIDGGTTDGSTGTVIAGGTEAVIASINHSANSITKAGAANWNAANGINGLVAGGYLFKRGNFGSKIVGLGSWFPATLPAPGATFGNVDRSVDSRLSGQRVSAQATIEETILMADELVFRNGGKGKYAILAPSVFRRLATALGSKVVLQPTKIGQFGFASIKIMGQSGEIDVVADPYCPEVVGYLLDPTSLWFHSVGKLVRFLGRQGQSTGAPLIIETEASAMSVRMGSMGQLLCRAPWKNARFAVAPAT